MTGWIINLEHLSHCRVEERHQEPIFLFSDGEPCFEVWIWHSELHRWFVMSHGSDPSMEDQGVIYFTPDTGPAGLVKQFEKLRADPN